MDVREYFESVRDAQQSINGRLAEVEVDDEAA